MEVKIYPTGQFGLIKYRSSGHTKVLLKEVKDQVLLSQAGLLGIPLMSLVPSGDFGPSVEAQCAEVTSSGCP